MSTTDIDGTQAGDVIAAARAWRDQDPDEHTRGQLTEAIDAATAGDATAAATLHRWFDSRIAFGTAGLRGAMGPGTSQMNRVLVAQAAAGLSAYLLRRAQGGAQPSLVIGYDGRHHSHEFALDTARIAAAAGVRTLLFDRALPTPVTAFALRHLDASAAVMVTASHNPANDNGYKVYLGGEDAGSQIISPADRDIAAEIDRAAASTTFQQIPQSEGFETVPEAVVQAYIDQTVAQIASGPRDIRFVYTAMHGVGWETARALFERLGFPAPATVDEQLHPDPDFPTVAFPNPEEPGALDLAFAKARETGADLIIANDPDADRLAVAVPDASAEAGWRRLTGNEVGWLLGEHIASQHAHDGTATLACSLVSSPLLGRIAEHYGLGYQETLTGFKFVNRVPGLVFGYEEALGYLVDPDLVRDKDGISAAAAFLALAAALKAEGETVGDALEELAGRYGAAASSQVSLRFDDVSRIGKVTAELRSTPLTEIAGRVVEHADDLLKEGTGLPPADILRYWLSDGSRVIVRPSGTEPKLKVYLDVASSAGPLAERETANRATIAELSAWWRQRLAA